MLIRDGVAVEAGRVLITEAAGAAAVDARALVIVGLVILEGAIPAVDRDAAVVAEAVAVVVAVIKRQFAYSLSFTIKNELFSSNIKPRS